MISPTKPPSPPIRPKVLIIDEANSDLIDVDGDGIGDLPHHELMERFIQAECPTVECEKILFDVKNRFWNRFSNGFKVLHQYKKEEYDAINMSLASYKAYDEITVKGQPIKPDQMHTEKEILRNQSWFNPSVDNALDLMERFLGKLKNQLWNPTKQGWMYIGAGNVSSSFNWLNFVSGAIHVGGELPLSSHNSLVNRLEPYIFNVVKLDEGFDINSDGRVDVSNGEVSGGPSFALSFVGKSLEEVLASPLELQRIKQGEDALCHKKLFSGQQLRALGWIDGDLEKCFASLGSYVFFDTKRMVFKPGFHLSHGRILYNPANKPEDNGKHVVNGLSGTSISAPHALGKDLQTAINRSNEPS